MAFEDGIADFRSDTVTRPTAAMRRAMAEAEVGDDAYGEDPTVNALQEQVAAAIGTEAALFVASGTMGNQVAVSIHSARGDDVITPQHAHIRRAEKGAAAAWSGVSFRSTGSERGVITADDLELILEEAGTFTPPVSLVTWENSHYFSGGTVVPAAAANELATAARSRGLAIHLDGARLWNAVVASAGSASAFAACADSVMFCFSKGLGAPVGSVLCGSAAFIDEARWVRKRFGGGMRQVGVIAAAAAVAFSERDRLVEDHRLAHRLGEELARRYEGAVDMTTVETNMVHIAADRLPVPAVEALEALAKRGVRAGLVAPGIIRFACHRDVGDADVDRLLAALDDLTNR